MSDTDIDHDALSTKVAIALGWDDSRIADGVPHYSRDISSAWKLIETWLLEDQLNDYEIGNFPMGDQHHCSLTSQEGDVSHGAIAATAPIAICLAYLEAHGG